MVLFAVMQIKDKIIIELSSCIEHFITCPSRFSILTMFNCYIHVHGLISIC